MSITPIMLEVNEIFLPRINRRNN